MKTIYLVGQTWYSGDQGDFPNNFEFPEKFFTSKDEAMEEYNRLSKRNQTWSFGFQSAYVVEMSQNARVLLKGRLNDGSIKEKEVTQ